jgi:predicted transcriptional regulator
MISMSVSISEDLKADLERLSWKEVRSEAYLIEVGASSSRLMGRALRRSLCSGA